LFYAAIEFMYVKNRDGTRDLFNERSLYQLPS